MGASVRVEDEAFNDLRYARLAAFAGLADADHARGKMEWLWRQCTIERRYTLPIGDVIRVLGECGPEALERAQLGDRIGDDEMRIRGTKGRVEWLDKKRKAGKKGRKYGVLGGRPRKPLEGFSEKPPPAPAPAPAPALKKREIPSSGRKVSLPPDWGPSAEHEDLARERGVDLDFEAAKFHDWALAKGQTYVRWDLAFANWLRNARRFANGHGAVVNGNGLATGADEDPVIA